MNVLIKIGGGFLSAISVFISMLRSLSSLDSSAKRFLVVKFLEEFFDDFLFLVWRSGDVW
jgi:hypothetical protein